LVGSSNGCVCERICYGCAGQSADLKKSFGKGLASPEAVEASSSSEKAPVTTKHSRIYEEVQGDFYPNNRLLCVEASSMTVPKNSAIPPTVTMNASQGYITVKLHSAQMNVALLPNLRAEQMYQRAKAIQQWLVKLYCDRVFE